MIWGFPPGRLFKAGRLLISDNFPPRMLIKGRTLIDFWKISLQDAYSRQDGYLRDQGTYSIYLPNILISLIPLQYLLGRLVYTGVGKTLIFSYQKLALFFSRKITSLWPLAEFVGFWSSTFSVLCSYWCQDFCTKRQVYQLSSSQ